MEEPIARIPVLKKTFNKLKMKKAKIQSKTSDKITWDKFLLKECDC
jgi:hypothetical protein